MVQALIDGGSPTPLTCGIPLTPTDVTPRAFVVVCAELARISRAGFPDVEDRLSAHGIFSAWRLQRDIEIGILHLGPSTGLDPVLEVWLNIRSPASGSARPSMTLAKRQARCGSPGSR